MNRIARTEITNFKKQKKMNTVIVKKELDIPVGLLLEVADILIENEISHEITGTDAENDCITLEVAYDKEQRDTIHEIEDLIDDYEEEDEDDDEHN
jgi:hypothetical protein